MEEVRINIDDYVKLNEAYLSKQAEIENKIKNDLVENRNEYPAGAEELYLFDYNSEISPESEDKLSLIEAIINDRFKQDYEELWNLREQIVGFVGHVELFNKEKTSEN